MTTKIYTIDATDKSVGRVATDAARFLIGKNSTTFRRNAASSVTVKIINASLAHINDKKGKSKTYKRYSGYPGGLKSEMLKNLAKRRGIGEIFKRAIKGMLPKNKLQAKMLKNLIING